MKWTHVAGVSQWRRARAAARYYLQESEYEFWIHQELNELSFLRQRLTLQPHTVDEIISHQTGRARTRIIFKTGKNWILGVEDAFTPKARTVAYEEEAKSN